MSGQGSGNKVVIVTGASRGLGREIAMAFGREGWRVAVCFRTGRRQADEISKAIAADGGAAIPLQVDMRDAVSVESMIADVLAAWGQLDLFINNAGVTRDGLCIRMSEQDWDDVIATNLTGPFHGIRAAAASMQDRSSGQIINVASIVGVQGREGQANYSASKAGLIGLTKAAARELGPLGIRVNAVLPGYLRTDMGETVKDNIRNRILAESVLGHPGDAVSTARFLVHLALLENVSGQVFNLDSRIL